ncbi:UNVERIFIED_CONTAM: hypothetical protein FKN15_071855 [Acipenser sinensis]
MKWNLLFENMEKGHITDPVFVAVLQVTISLSKVELSVGESKFFTCTAIGEPVSIEWFNPQGDRIVSSQRVVLQTESIRSRLTIYNANVEDAGIYRCQAANAKGQTQEATVVLEIYQKLTFRDVKTPQEFRQGEDAEIVCNVISSPVPIVTWIYNNREVTAMTDDRLGVLPNGNMQIQKVGKSDEGVYRCEARVEARGEIDFRDIAVIINVPPVLTVPQKSFNATADRQESVSFICTASGSPEPAITWYRNGRLIEESDQYFLKGRSTELTLRNIKQSDGGPYSCRATNKAGTEEKELLLKVFVQPHITQLKNMSAVEGSQTQISCTAEGEPVPEISWRRPSNGQTFADGDKSLDGRTEVRGRIGTSVLTISGVGLSDSGWFNCEAASRIGGHQKGMYLEVTPMSDKDFGQYDCTAGNTIGRRSQEYILAQADVPSNPYAVRLSSVSQAMATISFTKPDSHGGVPISYYQVDFKESISEDWRVVRSHGILSKSIQREINFVSHSQG